ncbi:MAG: phospholipase D-like domain-containing protein [Saprospiraceae bacterium]|nr:hypothetical protein [Lewinella sp.]
MKISNASFLGVGIKPVFDGEYYPTIIQLIRSADHQCYCSIFIIDHNLKNDADLLVDQILIELANAKWRGVDVKLLIGGSRDNAQIRKTAILAAERAKKLALDYRLASASKNNSNHSKLVIVDNYVLTGSHNWSRGMFGEETQDSVLLENGALAVALTQYFTENWNKSEQHEYDVSL